MLKVGFLLDDKPWKGGESKPTGLKKWWPVGHRGIYFVERAGHITSHKLIKLLRSKRSVEKLTSKRYIWWKYRDVFKEFLRVDETSSATHPD